MRTITSFIMGFGFCIMLFCIAAAPSFGAQSSNYNLQGKLVSKNELGCVSSGKISNKFTPVDLYKAMSACANQDKYNEGAFLFALAGTYGRFDTLRVKDKTAHQVVTILKMQVFSTLTSDKQKAFKNSVSKNLGSPEGLTAVCKEIVRIGPPSYYPRYMIEHGMDAFTKSEDENVLVKDFNERIAWKQSLDSYLHCSGK